MACKSFRMNLAVGCAAIVIVAPPASAQQRSFDVPAQDARTSIPEFARQAGIQISAPTGRLRGVRTKAIKGNLDARAALRALIEGTGLSIASDDGSLIVLHSAATSQNTPSPEGEERMAASLGEDAAFPESQEIIVTGSNIRGVADRFSPVRSVSRTEMDRSGFVTVPDLIAALPQNFGGGSVGTSIDSTGVSEAGTGAVGFNLRGIGSDATLTLLNGHRLAPGDEQGTVFDVSAIPVSAIDRVEILTDGASAIYGADAVAGVVNIILRKDYTGAETRIRYGGTTEGDGQELAVGQTLGKVWTGGRFLISGEYGRSKSIDSKDRSFSANAEDPTELLPDTRRYSVFVAGGVEAGTLSLDIDSYLNDRKSNISTTLFGSTYFNDGHIRQFGGSVEARRGLGSDWQLTGSLNTAQSRTEEWQDVLSPGVIDPLFQLVGKGRSGISTGRITVDGPVFDLGGGSAKVVFGGELRRDKFRGSSVDALSNSTFLDVENERWVRSLFAESYIPFVGADNELPGVARAAISLAARYESYSDVGDAFSPKFGATYSPANGVSLRATYGRSFRAPRLAQGVDRLDYVFLVNYSDPVLPGGQALGLIAGGATTRLEPEKSRNFTAGIDLDPAWLGPFKARVSYFDINFRNRIVTPLTGFDSVTGNYIDHDIPVQPIDALEIQALLDQTPLYFDLTDGSQPAANATILIDQRPINAAQTRAAGIDFRISYGQTTSVGRVSASVDGSYITRLSQRFTERQAPVKQFNRVAFPARFRLRGQIGIERGPLTATAFVNHVGAYQDDRDALQPSREVGSWTTVDMNVGYRFPATAGILSGLTINITARNLFDQDPPFITEIGSDPRRYNYDTANADPQGRYVSVQLTKQW